MCGIRKNFLQRNCFARPLAIRLLPREMFFQLGIMKQFLLRQMHTNHLPWPQAATLAHARLVHLHHATFRGANQ